MLYYSNAKINLGLNITKKRKDGFHNIETVFYPLALRDAMEFVPSERVGLTSSGIQIDCETEDNLIIKAYRLLKEDFDLPILKFHLHKIIPFGAGLGGGSANAASTLIELNKFYHLKLTEPQLMNYASKLGSDCAFFIKNKAVFAEEKGDVFTDLELNLSAHQIILIHPGFGVATPEAYAGIRPRPTKVSVTEIVQKQISSWKDELKNDFEETVFQKYSILADIKQKLYDNGAIYASMSGSGSSMFGIFEKEVADIDFGGFWTWKAQL